MPRDAVWVRDITLNNSTWGNRTFPLFNPRDNVYPIGAAIGPGMQLGIGAALGAKGRKVVCMCGDGGFFLEFNGIVDGRSGTNRHCLCRHERQRDTGSSSIFRARFTAAGIFLAI